MKEVKAKIIEAVNMGCSYVIGRGNDKLEIGVAYKNYQDNPEKFAYKASFYSNGHIWWCENGIRLKQAIMHVEAFNNGDYD